MQTLKIYLLPNNRKETTYRDHIVQAMIIQSRKRPRINFYDSEVRYQQSSQFLNQYSILVKTFKVVVS